MTRMNTMYDNMEFPQREYREYPKAIPYVDGEIQPTAYDKRGKAHPVVIVKNADEEAALGQSAKLVPVSTLAQVPVSRVETEDDVRADLYVRADQLGVVIDKRWSIERISKAIAEKEDI
jgi:hypothetical protein